MPHPEKLTAGWVESWEKFLAQNLPFKIFLKGRDLTYLACNENYAVDHGMKPSEIFGRSDYDLYPKELAEKYRADDLRILETGRSETIEESYVKDGQEFHVQTIKSLFRDQSDEVIGILGTFWDVTDRKRAEEALRESEAKYRSLVETAIEGVASIDLNGNLTFINDALCLMMGYSQDELLNKPFAGILHPDDLPAVMEAFLNAVAGTRTGATIEFRAIQKTGQSIWLSTQPTAIAIDGKAIGFNAILHNITERKRAEEVLKQSNERLLLATVAGGVGIWDLDVVNNKLTWDDQMFRLYGVAPDNFGGAYETWKERVHPEDVERSDAEVQMALRGEKEFDTEFRVVWPNGTIHHIRARAHVHRDAAGQPTKLIGTNYDITERKRAEEELRESESRYRELFEAESDAMVLIDNATGNILEANSAVAALYGYDRAELLTKRNTDLSAEPEETQRVTRGMPIISDQVVTIPLRFHRKKDGTVFPVEITGRFFIREGRPVHIAAIRDITERRRAEEALRDAHWRLESIIEGTHVGTWEWNVQTGETVYNEVWAQIIGYTLDELAPISIKTWETFSHPDDLKQSAELLERHFAGELPYHDYECRMKHKDGHWVWVHDRGRVITRTGDGKPLMMFGTHTDITAQKQAEEKLRESEEKYRTLFTSSSDAIMLVEPLSGKFTSGNQTMMKMFGLKNDDDFSSFGPWDFSPERQPDGRASAEKAKEMNEIAMRDGSNFFEWTHKRRNGEEFSADVRLTRMVLDKKTMLQATVRDITERKKSEEALRTAEANYRNLFERVPSGLYRSTLEGRFLEVNPAMADLYGYSSVQELMTLDIGSAFYRSAEERRQWVEKLLQVGELRNTEIQALRKDGSSMVLLENSRVVRDESEKVLFFEGTLTDTTDRKRVEEALRESKERLELALIGGNLGFYDWDLQTGRVYTDERYFGMLGYAPGEIDLGCRANWEQHVHPDDLGFANYPIQSDLRGETVPYDEEYRMRHKSGEWVWVRDRAQITARGADGRPLRVTGLHEDITERKRAEEALRESEERFHSLFENSTIGLYRTTPDGRILLANSELCRMLGFPSFEELARRNLEEGDLPTEYSRQAFRQKIEEKGEIRGLESAWERKDGTSIFVRESARVVRDAKGRILYYEGTVEDITERKRVEEALRTAEANYRNLFERVPSGLYRSTLEGRFLEVNPAMADLYGYSSVQELMTLDIGSAFYRSAEERRQWVEKLLQVGELRNTEIQALRKDGSSMVLLENSRVVRDESGKVLFFEGTLTDTTDRKRAEEALRESEEQYRTLFDEALDGICLADAETGLIIDCNQALATLAGRERAELIGQPQRILHPINTGQEVFSPTFRQHLTEKEGQILETQVVTRTGIIKEVEIKANLLNLQGRKILQEAFHDITDRKQIEGEMDKTRADFLFGVSHELKTPLFLMDISLEMLENSPESGRAKRTKEFMETWKRNLHRLEHLVFNMVDSQRTQTMGFKIERQSTDFGALIERVVQEQELLAGPKKVRITMDLAPMPPLFIDPDAIHRLVENLLTNAVKFSPRSGEVTIRLAEEDTQAVLTLKDQGHGISAEEQKGLFLPFQRAATAVRSVIPGTGLGLYVAKIIVDAHGGTISLQSKVGRGTTVTVRLPLGMPQDKK